MTSKKLMQTSSENLAQRRTSWTFIRSLLWKNWLIKNRQPAATACEILVPTFFILLLGVLKLLTDCRRAGKAGSIEWVDTDLPKFALHESTMTGLMLKLGRQSIDDGLRLEDLSASDLAACRTGVLAGGLVDTNTSSPFSVPTECAGKVVPYKIGVTPDNAFTRSYFAEAMDMWYPRLDLINSTTETLTIPSFKESIQFFDTNDALTDYVKSDNYGDNLDNPKIYAAIVFDSAPSGDDIGSFGSIEYSLRLNSTKDVDSFQKDIVTDYYSVYTVTGFMTLQTLVTRFVTCMPEWISANQSTTGVCQRLQTTAVASSELDNTLLDVLTEDGLIQEALSGIGMSGVTSFSTILAGLSNSTKEALLTPLRQAPQSMLGATVAPFPVDHYTSSPFYDNKELRLREFMKILGVTEKHHLDVVHDLSLVWWTVPNSSVIVTFLFFFLFGLSVLALAFLISTLFSKARVGAFVGMVAFFAMYAISQGFSDSTAENTKRIGSILSPVALSLGVNVLANAEKTGEGVQFSTMDTLSHNYRISTAVGMFAFDTVLYTVLGLYFAKVMPKEYGTTLKWYFPPQENEVSTETPADNLLDNVTLELNPDFEPVSTDLREQERNGEALTVKRLRKVFQVPGGEKIAVKGLDITMYKDQITCLLGHNGAGKTTLISMLTGMTAPSSGNATYRGLSINEDMDEMRRSLGSLTVQEHLQFFGQIKGYANEELQAVSTDRSKRNSRPNDLSGGMKRKLSVAVSLLGDSSLVFLDEPTSGMDPYSRRSTWEILLNNRNDRVMVLTTHFMDEADILGDREMRCCGSSLFLKNRFGAGYNLTLVKETPSMDRQLQTLGLLSYGVSVTTLEEVFIKVASWAMRTTAHAWKTARMNPGFGWVLPAVRRDLTTESIFQRHLPFRYAKRDKKAIIYVAALPVLLIAASSSVSDDSLKALATDPYSGSATPRQWCSDVMASSYFSGANAQMLSIPEPAFDSNSPTVFDVTYTDPSINASGTTGYSLALGQQLYERGYGKGADLVEGQYGGYLLYGDSNQNLFGYNIFTNTTASHSSVVFKALMDQAVLKVNNYPLPYTAAAKAVLNSNSSFTASLFICIAFTFLPASIVVFLVKEKQAEHNSKHQQLVSGVSLPAFWLSNYIWDFVMYAVPGVRAVLIYTVITARPHFPAVISCSSSSARICPSLLPVVPFKDTRRADVHDRAQLMIGVVLMLTSFILDMFGSTSDVNSVLKFLWRFSPLFNLGSALLNMVTADVDSIQYSEDGKTNPFSGDVMGWELLYLVLTAAGYMSLTLYLDYAKTFAKTKDDVHEHENYDENNEIDEDVQKEADRVAAGHADEDAVKLVGLRKVYPGGKVAVRNLSFGLKRGECFGFLGINGAGKTTTMKMLTGDVQPSHGTATLGGFDILSQQIEVRRQIGYCPQFDALFDLLSVREHLELFGAIKGIPQASLDRVVMEKIQQLNLGDFEHKLAGSLSGGNKRKLSVAIAMIGNPAIIFLDEPSTGMDPVSRRFMWDVIADISTRGKESTIVLTTHSMEECEALCSRVGIMCAAPQVSVRRRPRVDVKLDMPSADELEYLVQHIFGSGSEFVTPVELEDKCRAFGNADLAERVTASHPTGYSLAAAMERDGFIRAEAFCSWCVEETRFDELSDYLVRAFGAGQVVVMERQNDFARFKVRSSNNEVKLSKMFALVEDVKAKMHIREYSVSQTTLEQIFNSFASQQEEEHGAIRGVYQGAKG
ncbi:P-loop containing nucleoside triphosphate hydrolase [Phytophthora cactorum]|nr:P-loop containing nucleoside triphosphate hydrolase [Phytophthora cactorum]